ARGVPQTYAMSRSPAPAPSRDSLIGFAGRVSIAYAYTFTVGVFPPCAARFPPEVGRNLRVARQPQGGLGAIGRACLGDDAGHVVGHGLRLDVQQPADVFVRQTS